MRFTISTILALALLGSACGDDSPSTPTSPSSPATPSGALVTVDIRNFLYQPNPVTVKVGTQINWHNLDSVDHTATREGMFDNFVNAMSAHGAPVTMGTAGTFEYHCRLHSNMKGTIVVQP
jgi:plastocyanin